MQFFLSLFIFSKRVRLDDGCNNNLNEISETSKSNGTHWSCSGDTSFVEPEILEDMGVSMLEDEESCENDLKKPRLQEPSPTQSQIKNVCNNQESGVYRHSSFETVVPDKYDRFIFFFILSSKQFSKKKKKK